MIDETLNITSVLDQYQQKNYKTKNIDRDFNFRYKYQDSIYYN